MPEDSRPTIHNENKPREPNYMGYFITILIFLFGQTIAGAFWAGSISRGQDASQETIKELKADVNTLRNQNQVLSMQVSALEARQKETDQRKGNK